MEEIAEVLGLSFRTAHREWRLAKAWLHGQLRPKDEQGGGEGRKERSND